MHAHLRAWLYAATNLVPHHLENTSITDRVLSCTASDWFLTSQFLDGGVNVRRPALPYSFQTTLDIQDLLGQTHLQVLAQLGSLEAPASYLDRRKGNGVTFSWEVSFQMVREDTPKPRHKTFIGVFSYVHIHRNFICQSFASFRHPMAKGVAEHVP